MGTKLVRKATKRSDEIKVRLQPGVKQRLHAVADVLGVPASTVAALAIGAYLGQQERALSVAEKVGEGMGEALKEALGEQFSLLTKAPPK